MGDSWLLNRILLRLYNNGEALRANLLSFSCYPLAPFIIGPAMNHSRVHPPNNRSRVRSSRPINYATNPTHAVLQISGFGLRTSDFQLRFSALSLRSLRLCGEALQMPKSEIPFALCSLPCPLLFEAQSHRSSTGGCQPTSTQRRRACTIYG